MAIYPADTTLPKPTGRRPGEGSSRKARGRALGFMVIALLAASGAGYLVMRALAARANVAQPKTTQIVVAALDIPLATTLKPEMMVHIDWPTHALPQGAFTDASALDSRVASREILKGEPLLESRLAAAGTGLGMAAVIPKNMRAMTVQVNEVIGVSGFIHPGDLVDVVVTMQKPLNGRGMTGDQEFRAKIVLQEVKVLAIGQDMVTQNAKPVKVPVVTLLVTPDESERLALSSTQGKVQLTLRSQADDARVATTGVSPPELLSNGPVPEPRPSVTRVVVRQTAPKGEVVEILRGDRLEERKLRNTGEGN